MCGIAGGFFKANDFEAKVLIDKILASQHHRGPDARKSLRFATSDDALILGHNRLSIIDVNDRATQPFVSFCNGYYLVFNGMIYNFKSLRQELKSQGIEFRTTSDTEVLLNAYIAWGKACLEKLEGMFAFAIYDKAKEKLLLARDRFGVKPLFYYQDNKNFVFASSVKEMAKYFSCSPNLSYVAKGISQGLYEDDSAISPYQNIKALPSSHCLTFCLKNKRSQLNQYYDLYHQAKLLENKYSQEPESLLSMRFVERFNNAIQKRLCSDVPLGLSISGGLDSSSIASIAANKKNNLLGFHYGNPNDKKSEGPLVNQVANFCNFSVDYITIPTKDIIHQFEKTLNAQEAPFAGLSVVAQHAVFERAHLQGMKVLLGGQGGDEALMGYRKFMLFYQKQLIKEKKHKDLLKMLCYLPLIVFSEIPRLRLYMQAGAKYLGRQKSSGVLNYANFDVNNDLANLEKGLMARQVEDVTRYSLPTLLRYEDRNSMANSIETRLPFLDHDLLAYSISLPSSMKVKKGYGKWLLREVMKEKLPQNLLTSRFKRGFDVGEKKWLSNGLGHHIRERLKSKQSVIDNLCKKNINIDECYSDKALLNEKIRMREAISFIWLGEHF